MVQWWKRVELDRASPEPLYRQLQQQITESIDRGQLRPGERLPASRDLAAELGVNRATVTSAYERLAKQGRVRSHVGQGTFVSEAGGRAGTHRWSFSRAVESVRHRVRSPADLSHHPDPVDFATLVPDEELFPVESFRAALNDVLAKDGKKLLQYGPAAGHPPLRSYIAERLRRRGVACSEENVLVVNGTQQALDLICRALLDPGDRVVVERPTYTIILPLLAQCQATVEEVPMTSSGMDLDALERTLARVRPKLVFTMPTFQNPTGITMALGARRRLMAIASRFGVPIVEDDFDSHLRLSGNDLPPLKAFDEGGLVVHVGTFSKGLFPGLRLGWISAGEQVVSALSQGKLIADYHTSLLLQSAILEFCRRGHYDDHLERLPEIYRPKARTLVEAMERFFPEGVTWTRPEGGFAFWVTLPEGLVAERVLEESARRGVVFTPGSYFFAHGGGEHFFRLSISRVPLERIEDGVKTLGAAIDHLLGRTPPKELSGDARRHEPMIHI